MIQFGPSLLSSIWKQLLFMFFSVVSIHQHDIHQRQQCWAKSLSFTRLSTGAPTLFALVLVVNTCLISHRHCLVLACTHVACVLQDIAIHQRRQVAFIVRRNDFKNEGQIFDEETLMGDEGSPPALWVAPPFTVFNQSVCFLPSYPPQTHITTTTQTNSTNPPGFGLKNRGQTRSLCVHVKEGRLGGRR